MLQSEKKWKFSTETNDNLVLSDDTFKITKITEELLYQRGVHTIDKAKQFLNPSLDDLICPSKLTDIEKACERINEAISKGERILVYGDYDADGVTSTTVMLETLQELGAYCDFYIPNRFTEGYGPNENAFRQAHEAGVTLIITVDNGISAVHEAEVARELGIDLIITDHHEVQEELPNAYAIIHPKCSPDYSFKEPAGVGVAFKLAEQLLGYFPKQFLDLVAIGTVADLVPLVEENRIFVRHGLEALTNTKRPGLIALKEIAKIEDTVTEEAIGFLIGPRLNAVGRLQDANLAVDLLTCETIDEARIMAEEVQELNLERQRIVAAIAKEAEQIIHEREDDLPGVIVVSKEGWNEGVLGIVASQLVRKFDRPAIVLAKHTDRNIVKGSARSIPSFDLFTSCMSLRHLFTTFGGHAQAAGMTLPIENEAELQVQLSQLIHEQLTEDDFRQEIEISRSLTIDEATEQLVDEISRLQPFGMANPKPIFHFEHIPTDIRQLGNMKKHLKLQFAESGQALEGIGFGMGPLYEQISPETTVSIVGELGINEWNGNKKVQMIMRDLCINEWQLFDYRGRKNIDIPENSNEVIANIRSENDESMEGYTYQTDIESLSAVDTVCLYDLPDDLTKFTEMMHVLNPSKIYACFYVESSSYLESIPSREAFKWFYGLILQRKVLDLKKEMNAIMKHKNWSRDSIIFMSQVFQELAFIEIQDGILTPVANPEKSDLETSTIYQVKLQQQRVEKKLYYSTYDELKAWFERNCLQLNGQQKEEALLHGL